MHSTGTSSVWKNHILSFPELVLPSEACYQLKWYIKWNVPGKLNTILPWLCLADFILIVITMWYFKNYESPKLKFHQNVCSSLSWSFVINRNCLWGKFLSFVFTAHLYFPLFIAGFHWREHRFAMKIHQLQCQCVLSIRGWTHKATVIWSEALMKFGSRVGYVPVLCHRKCRQSIQQS